MNQVIDLSGKLFKYLTVIKRVENAKSGVARWLCQCKCGKQTIIQGGNLKSGHTKSCGCLNQPHGHNRVGKRSKTYETWYSMIQRCTNSNSNRYEDYGGRGIYVCEAWLKFEGFLQDMGERPPNMSIDRIDNNGDYCKENCKWSTRKEQQRNTQRTIWITINSVTKCLAEWCEYYGLKYNTIYARIYQYAWTPEEALELVPRCKKA